MGAAILKETARVGENELDSALVERAKSGDRRAFDLLVRKYQHKVLGLVARYVRNPSECEDVAQEAFVRAWRALGSFRGDSAFSTWLHTIAVNTAKNYLASAGRRPPAEDIDVDEAAIGAHAERMQDSATPERELLRQEIERTVFDTVQRLPEELRTAITLREVEGMSYEEIAEAMGCPVGTVRSRIFRAREAIDEKLRPLLSDRED
ncbi:RNA polymerase sigma factor RpoE [Aerosticca soli]|jgi:RNA polymerase sigma-70 factor (ECF subfamily)|uniref:RNA polymerase sigma factor RpoE n=1 Tax=Aerosticca soli TaxID=2010829 RepID=A0A2Z6E4K5_9GAMM|nr:RNA polymerase sigma factor RpoE [Aerosticca soli]MDI3261596.1 RNA polymerase sigma factor RpoE [Fulvimonas sp.]BBD79943.1 RNA polymerase sigma factor RpoE [Aerosticca soli]